MKDEDVYIFVTLLLLRVKTWENSWEKLCSRSCVLWFIIENNESQIMVSKYAGRCLSFLFFACYDVCVCHSCNETSRWLAQIVTHCVRCVENWFWMICKWFSSHTSQIQRGARSRSDEANRKLDSKDEWWTRATCLFVIRKHKFLLHLVTFELFRSHFKPQGTRVKTNTNTLCVVGDNSSKKKTSTARKGARKD